MSKGTTKKAENTTAKETESIFPSLGERVIPQEEPKEKTSYTLRELLEMNVDELPCLFDSIFLKSGIAVMVGGSDSGKSTFLRQMCMCVATGRDFLGWRYKGEHNRAIYFSSEDDAILTAKVVKRYNETMLLDEGATDRLLFDFDIDPNTITERIEERLSAMPSDLVVIDAFGDAFWGKSLNDNLEVRQFYATFKAIAKKHNCLIIFNHHTGKRTSANAPDKDNSLGSQAIEAAPRLAMELRMDPTDIDVKHLCIVKANYLGSEYKKSSYALRMDQNYVLTPTGERVEFANLAKPIGSQATKRKTKPTDFSEDEHQELLREIFSKGDVNQKTLLGGIASEFEITTRTVSDNFLPYYSKRGWIAENSKGGHCNQVLYSCNLVRKS